MIDIDQSIYHIKMEQSPIINFVDVDSKTALGQPQTIEKIAKIASRAINLPEYQFMDLCRIYYMNMEEQEIQIYDSMDLQLMINSINQFTIFVQRRPNVAVTKNSFCRHKS